MSKNGTEGNDTEGKVALGKSNQVKTGSAVSRRELLAKYGAYTTPTVVALLIPGQAYGHIDSTITYSTSLTCAADPAGGSMHSVSMGLMGHCMLNSSGGGQTHMVTYPTVE